MIEIKLNENTYKVTPTIFPDGTSQVWKIPEQYLSYGIDIYWWWEGDESELFHLTQLLEFYTKQFHGLRTPVVIPYSPYARQDKDVNNELTFAGKIFDDLLKQWKYKFDFQSFDKHSKTNNYFFNIEPYRYITKAINSLDNDVVLVFPDNGASERYKVLHDSYPYIIMDKDRDQLTGKINGLYIKGGYGFDTRETNKKYLIVDDLCDGGYTFILATKALKQLDPNSTVSLYVSHGIFSKGVQCLFDAGIDNIYTTNSLKEFWIKKEVDISKVVVYNLQNLY